MGASRRPRTNCKCGDYSGSLVSEGMGALARLGLLSLLLTGCTGLIFDPGASPEEPTTPGGGSTTPPPPPGTVTNPELCTDVAPAPVRRLSRTEYRATLEDLFPTVSVDFELVSDPDEHGFENRAELLSPQPLLIEQYSDVAAEVAAAAIADKASWMPCDASVDGEDACAATFLAQVGLRIFRRPLTAEEIDRYQTFLDAERAASSFDTAVQLTVEAMLQAPQFLYRLELGRPSGGTDTTFELTPYEVATRLSYLLWGSAPDEELLAVAGADELTTPEQREAQARRMLDDPRASRMLEDFHRQWLDFDQLYDESKDSGRYPEWDSSLVQAAREESDRFVSRVIWQGEGTFRALLTSTETEVNPALADLYGVSAPSSGWQPATLDATERAGILTRAGFLAGRAHRLEGSPPLRGIFVYERILCRAPPSPPADADLSEPASSGAGTMTNRQLFEERTSPPACHGCHSNFEGLGFAFENFDAIGRFRTTDNGLPVDATGTFDADGETWDIADAVDLSHRLADSDEALGCVAGRWFEYAAGRASDATDQCRVASVFDDFEASGGDMRELLVSFAMKPAFTERPAFEAGR